MVPLRLESAACMGVKVTASDWLPDWLNTYVVFCSQDYVTSALKLSELGAKWDDQPAVLPE